ncbi:MAG TPA: hypothetical protein VJ417_15905, partial [Candidatus Glassbacteria bacterium]|nr:hypothetical protein [Candidatus Glassbacteria bacterium]
GEPSRIQYNRILTSLDADELAAWPIEGRIPRGDPNGVPDVSAGGETMFFHSSEVFNSWSDGRSNTVSSALEWTLRFLDFAESNNMVYGHVFIRNMSEYMKWNPNNTFRATGQAHPNGWTWNGLIVVSNNRNTAFGGNPAGWAMHAEKRIIGFYNHTPNVGGWTPPTAPLMGFKMINMPHTADEMSTFTSLHEHDWCSEFGFSGYKQMYVGFPPSTSYKVALDVETGYYPGVTNPYTGKPLRGAFPGMLHEDDARYRQWIWGGPCNFMVYNNYGELHDIAPRDTVVYDFAYMLTYPSLSTYTVPEYDLANLDAPVIQELMSPLEHMAEIAEVVTNSGFQLPVTPTSPTLTIIPGDRQVTLTWSDVNLQTPDPFYSFLQDYPELDPDGVYREYDFEGFRVYRSFVGPNDSHSEQMADYNLSSNNLQFHYIDKLEDDQPRFRMINGMKVWYAVVAYDSNVDPATGDGFSLPDPSSGKTWNRPGATLYTVIPHSDASNYRPAELMSYGYVKPSGYSVDPAAVDNATLTGATGPTGVTWLSQDPVYIIPRITPTFEAVNNERIASDQSFYLLVSSDMGPNGYRAGRRNVVLADASLNVTDDSGPGIQIRGGQNNRTAYSGGMSANGVAWSVAAEFQGSRQGNAWTQIDPGTYAGATMGIITDRWGWSSPSSAKSYSGTGIFMGLLRTGGFEIT